MSTSGTPPTPSTMSQKRNVWMPTLTPGSLASRYPQVLHPSQLQERSSPSLNHGNPPTSSAVSPQGPSQPPSTVQNPPNPPSAQTPNHAPAPSPVPPPVPPPILPPVPPPVPHATRPKVHSSQAQQVQSPAHTVHSAPQPRVTRHAPAPMPPSYPQVWPPAPAPAPAPAPSSTSKKPSMAPPRPSGTGAVFEVGMIFPSMEEAREALLCHTIALHESYRVYKSDARRYMTRCRGRDCGYMVRVTWRKRRCEAVVSVYKPHTCSPDTHDNWRPAASVNYLVPTYQSLFEGSTRPTAAQIQDIERRRGNPIQYHQGYRTLKAIERNLYGDAAESFKKLPAFLSRLAKIDHGGYWKLETKNDIFNRCFIAPAATINAYSHCRRFLTIDRAPWKTKWDFSLLVAVTLDANNQVLPLAWAVVPNESVEEWVFFLYNLRLVFPKINDPQTALLLNPRLGIDNAVLHELPDVALIYCCEHLSQTLMEKFRPEEEVRKLFWKAARAESEPIFEQAMAQIKHQRAREWIQSIPRHRWAKHALPVSRYDQLTMTTMESANFLWLNTRNTPILRTLYSTWLNITDRLHHCREFEFKRSNALTDYAQEWIVRQKQLCRTYQIVASSQEQFTVFKNAMGYVVDLHARTCSCREWQDLQLPCRHALAAIATTSRPINDFVPEIYLIATYKNTYSGVLMPLELRDLDNYDKCIAPAKRRGKPSTDPPRPPPEDVGLQRHCAVCRQPGHSGQSDICPSNMRDRNIIIQDLPDGIRVFEHKPGPPIQPKYPSVAVVVPPMPDSTVTSAPTTSNDTENRRRSISVGSSSDDNDNDDAESPNPGFSQVPPLPDWARLPAPPDETPASSSRTSMLDFGLVPREAGPRLEWALNSKRRLDAERQDLPAEELCRLQGQILDGLFGAEL